MGRVFCFSPNRAILEELASVLSRCLPEATACDVHGYPSRDELPRELGAGAPELCLVDVVSDRPRSLALIEALRAYDPEGGIIALLAADDPDLILKCLRVGASEFLLHPFEAEHLKRALEKLKIQPGDRTGPSKLAKVICVMPAKGACGASTLACNLANRLKNAGNRVLLADLDPLAGSISFLLKISPSYTFLDVLSRAESLDADLWRGMVTSRAGIDVLLAPELLAHGVSESRDATPIIEFARRIYDIVVVDAGSAYGEWNLSQARTADEVLLVTTNELPALHGAQRSLSYLEANRIPKWKVRVIVNRYDKSISLSKEVISSALHIDVLHTIPSDYDAVQKALLDGKPVAPNSPLGRMFGQLADRLTGREKETQTRSAPFGGLLSLFFRPS